MVMKTYQCKGTETGYLIMSHYHQAQHCFTREFISIRLEYGSDVNVHTDKDGTTRHIHNSNPHEPRFFTKGAFYFQPHHSFCLSTTFNLWTLKRRQFFKERHKLYSNHTLRKCRMSLSEKRVEKTTSGRKRNWIILKNEEIHGFLFLFEYYGSNEFMQDEEEVGYGQA